MNVIRPGIEPAVIHYALLCKENISKKELLNRRSLLEMSTDLMGQGKAEEIAARGDSYKLVAVHCVAHGRGMQGLPGIEVP